MNYQQPLNELPGKASGKRAKAAGAPMYSSTWLALFVLIRSSLQQTQSS